MQRYNQDAVRRVLCRIELIAVQRIGVAAELRKDCKIGVRKCAVKDGVVSDSKLVERHHCCHHVARDVSAFWPTASSFTTSQFGIVGARSLDLIHSPDDLSWTKPASLNTVRTGVLRAVSIMDPPSPCQPRRNACASAQ